MLQLQWDLVPQGMMTNHMDINTNTLTVVIATSCSVLGLLLVVTVVLRSAETPQGTVSYPAISDIWSTPSPTLHRPTGEPLCCWWRTRTGWLWLHFADGIQVVLPSYEEAIRARHSGSRLSRFNSDSSHSSGRSSRSDYRPLPPIHRAGEGQWISQPILPLSSCHLISTGTTTGTPSLPPLALPPGITYP